MAVERHYEEAARSSTILKPKTTPLLHLGAAMALGCIPAQLRAAEQRKKEKK